jgi:hypothetical protein
VYERVKTTTGSPGGGIKTVFRFFTGSTEKDAEKIELTCWDFDGAAGRSIGYFKSPEQPFLPMAWERATGESPDPPCPGINPR